MQQPMADDVGVYLPTAAEDAYKPEFRPKFEATPYNFAVTLWNMNYAIDQVADQVTDQVADQVAQLLAALGKDSLSAVELMERLGLSHRPTFRQNYLHPALESGLVEMAIPDKPNQPH